MNEQENNNQQNLYDQAYGVQANASRSPRSQTDGPILTDQGSVAYAQPVVPQKKSHGWVIAIVIILAIAVFCIISVVSCSAMFSSAFSSAIPSFGGSDYKSPSTSSVGVIEMSGTIQYDGSACSPSGLRELLDEAAEDDDIVAVVLHVNSGGGTATAGEEMAQYVRDFEKPIVVASAATNASAAYEISSQADYIFTASSTFIGSIGTIMQITDLSGLYDKLGINTENIVSADSKDAGGGTRPLTDEERAWYQDMVDQVNGLFIQNVADGRDMSIEEAKQLANGLPYTGIDAVENGLADEIGTLEDAVGKASELAGYDHALPQVDLVRYESSLMDLLDLFEYSSNHSEEELNAAAELIEELKK